MPVNCCIPLDTEAPSHSQLPALPHPLTPSTPNHPHKPSSTSINLQEIPIMRARTTRRSPRIARRRINSRNNLDIGRGDSHIIRAGNPVLRAGVAEALRGRRQLGDGVVGVRDAVLRVHVGDVLRQGEVAHAGLPVGVLFSLLAAHPHQIIIEFIKRGLNLENG